MTGKKRDGSYFRDRWRDLVASADGPPSATTRHVLLTLSLHMDLTGYCFPSTKRLAQSTGLSERVVCRHLALAVDGGWVSKDRRQGASGQGWRRNEYQGTLPEALTESKHLIPEGTDAGSARSAKGTDSQGKKALTQGQSNQLRNQVSKLEGVCLAMGADWDRAGLTPEQWITEKSEEPRFAALDFAAVFVDAADYLSSARCTTKYTSPSLFLLYQLKAAAKRCDGSAPQNQPDSLRGAA